VVWIGIVICEAGAQKLLFAAWIFVQGLAGAKIGLPGVAGAPPAF